MLVPSLSWYKVMVLSHLYINAIFLPRHALDEHRQNSKKTN
eukprot:COSAG06_NODE_34410_length_475_cov_0.436170_1_plen_40_part_10